MSNAAALQRAHAFAALVWLAAPIASFGQAPTEPVDYVQYAIGALIVVQTILIVILIIQNRRHLRAKADAQKQYGEITHTARLALGGITASVAHEVTQPLSAILSNG